MRTITGIRGALADMRCPMLLLTSPQDHVVDPASSDLVARSAQGQVERRSLDSSFHVATLDHDPPLIEQQAVAFAQRVGG